MELPPLAERSRRPAMNSSTFFLYHEVILFYAYRVVCHAPSPVPPSQASTAAIAVAVLAAPVGALEPRVDNIVCDEGKERDEEEPHSDEDGLRRKLPRLRSA